MYSNTSPAPKATEKVDYSYYSKAQILILTSVPAPPAATVSAVHWLAGWSSPRKIWRDLHRAYPLLQSLLSTVSSCLSIMFGSIDPLDQSEMEACSRALQVSQDTEQKEVVGYCKR